MALVDPDDAVVATFSTIAVKNESKSAAANRPIFDDMEVCQLRYPGKKDTGVYPATSVSHWRQDPITGDQVKVTYAERFSRQYRQFKEHATQTKSGTPLSEVAFLTEARRAELRALNVYTVEALASIDGIELKNLGPGGRDMKNGAMDYLESTKRGIPSAQLLARLEALEARNAVLEEDNKALKIQQSNTLTETDSFDEMTVEQLRDYIETTTGHAPHGTPNKRTLIRMARGLKEQAA